MRKTLVLRTATVSGTGTTDYRYYADGTRAEKIAPGNLTSQFYYMGGLGYLDAGDTEFAANQEIAEYDGATLLRRYVRLPGSVDEAFLMIDQSLPAGDRERWAHPNRLGSTIVISDGTGAVIDTHTYSPFGQAGEGDGGFPFRFTGQKLDPETGLYYYKARYYDPELGRFLQTDPIGYADQMNLYAYVGNDPVNATDPTGEQSVGCDACSSSMRRDGLSEQGIRDVQNRFGRGAGELTGEAVKSTIYRPGENFGRPAITLTLGGGVSGASGNVGASESVGGAMEVTFTPAPIITGFAPLRESSSNINPFDPSEVVAGVGVDSDVGFEFALGTISDQIGGATVVEGDFGAFGLSLGASDSASGVFSPGNSVSIEFGPGAQLGGFHTETRELGGNQ